MVPWWFLRIGSYIGMFGCGAFAIGSIRFHAELKLEDMVIYPILTLIFIVASWKSND